MNAAARIFVVLNIILAAGFLLAAATFLHQNDDWRAQLTSEQKAHESAVAEKNRELEAVRTDLQNKSKDYDRLRQTSSALENDKSNLETRLEAVQREKENAERNLQTLQASHDALSNSVSALRDELNSLTRQVDTYRSESLVARDAQLEAQASFNEAQQNINTLDNQRKELEDTLAAVNKTLRETANKLETYVKVYPPPRAPDQPSIDAVVTGYDAGTQLVEINKGSSAGVKLGYTFDIVRGTDYIGTVRIDRVDENVAVGSLEIPMAGRKPRSGDRVTRL